MRKLIILFILIFVFFVANVYAQSSGPRVTITVIGAGTHSFGPLSPDSTKVDVKQEVRDPTANDIIKGVKNGAQVAITIPQSNGTFNWAHSLRIRAVNLTTYNGTNTDNETIYYNDVKVYDPTTGRNYTTQLATITGNPRGYIYWYGWVPIRDIFIIKSHSSPGNRIPTFHKPGRFYFLPLIKYR